jgi:tetratricopeptide (TPR) repeat protein
MDLFETDLDEKIWENFFKHSEGALFSDEEFADMTAQADAVINNEKEAPQRRAEACVKKFRLLETRRKLAPKLLEKALELCPNMSQALLYMGIFLLHTENRDKALEYFDKAAAAQQPFPYAWLEKAFFADSYEEKICFYSEFIKLKPDSKFGHEERCKVYGDKLFKLMEYSELMELDSYEASMPDALLIIQKAIKDYTELIRLDPLNWIYYNKRAEMHLRESKANRIIYGEEDLPPAINNDALNDIEQFMLLHPVNNSCDCLEAVSSLLILWANGIATKYLNQIIGDMPPGSVAYLIAKILLAIQYEYSDEKNE